MSVRILKFFIPCGKVKLVRPVLRPIALDIQDRGASPIGFGLGGLAGADIDLDDEVLTTIYEMERKMSVGISS